MIFFVGRMSDLLCPAVGWINIMNILIWCTDRLFYIFLTVHSILSKLVLMSKCNKTLGKFQHNQLKY